jgi:hypothetical protein
VLFVTHSLAENWFLKICSTPEMHLGHPWVPRQSVWEPLVYFKILSQYYPGGTEEIHKRTLLFETDKNNTAMSTSLWILPPKQPCDHGLLDDVSVLQVTRHGAEAVHFVESALPIGKLVTLKLDWERRLDHMQQHSGKIWQWAQIYFVSLVY